QVVTLPLWGVARANDLPRAPRLTGAPLAAVQLRHQRADLGVVEAERVAEPVPLLRRRNRRRLTGGGGPMAGHAVEPEQRVHPGGGPPGGVPLIPQPGRHLQDLGAILAPPVDRLRDVLTFGKS